MPINAARAHSVQLVSRTTLRRVHMTDIPPPPPTAPTILLLFAAVIGAVLTAMGCCTSSGVANHDPVALKFVSKTYCIFW